MYKLEHGEVMYTIRGAVANIPITNIGGGSVYTVSEISAGRASPQSLNCLFYPADKLFSCLISICELHLFKLFIL